MSQGTGTESGPEAPQERPTQRAAESGPQGTAQAVNTEDRRTHTRNTQTSLVEAEPAARELESKLVRRDLERAHL